MEGLVSRAVRDQIPSSLTSLQRPLRPHTSPRSSSSNSSSSNNREDLQRMCSLASLAHLTCSYAQQDLACCSLSCQLVSFARGKL